MQADLAQAKARARPRARSNSGLLDFIRQVSPHLQTPVWFAPYATQLETAVGSEHELVFAAPPQHGKTVITAHALVWNLIKHPSKRFGYATYNLSRARSVARYFRQIAFNAGLELTGTLEHAYTSQGGGCLFAGRGTSVTGEPIDGFGVVDDPFKDRAEADSAVIRESTDDWHKEVWLTRHHPGTSSFVMATRWHEDDLSGRLVKRGWPFLNLPAIAEEDDPLGRAPGAPLCASRWPATALAKKRERLGEFAWWALYQGHPRPRGGALFNGATFVDTIPTTGWRVSIGLDLAYSKRTHADYSVAVVVAQIGKLIYVLDVLRAQVRAPEFAVLLKPIVDRFPGVVPRWYCAGAEVGVADLFSDRIGRAIEAIPIRIDKFAHAQDCAAKWNAQQIVVPRDRPWVDPFVAEIRGFTGVNDTNDDQVDGLINACDALPQYEPSDDDFLSIPSRFS